MERTKKPTPGVATVDKALLRRMAEEMNARIGLRFNPKATAENARRLMEADGVQPEDNLFSCGIIAARDEE